MLLKLFVEFFGTFVFLFVIFTTLNPLYIGLTLGALVAIFKNISANFNPAVTIASFYSGSLSKKLVIPFITVQLCGSLLAIYLAKRMKLLK